MSTCYYVKRRKYRRQVWTKFLECRKCYILLLVIYLICMPSALGPAALELRAYISGKSLVPMLQLYYIVLLKIDCAGWFSIQLELKLLR